MSFITHDQLTQAIDDFLVFKNALGWPYRRGAATLRSFERFARKHADQRSRIDLEPTLSAWLARVPDRKPVTVALELGVIRQLCHYRRRSVPNAFVPGREWAPQSTTSCFLPTILSQDDVRRIIEAATMHQACNLSGSTLRCLILILYCTGLRLGEAVRLRRRDLDLEHRQFTVRESKGKTRIVPFADDLSQELQHYLAERTTGVSAAGDSPVLVRRSGDAIPVGAASEAIRQLLRQLQLKPAQGRAGPRPYDLRHAFAVHRLSDWYRQGVDIHARLPWLSAYMGHNNVLGTEAYLTATPELMAVASQRFEARLRGARKPR